MLKAALNNYSETLQTYGFTLVVLPAQLKYPVGLYLSASTMHKLRKLEAQFGPLT